MANLLAGRRNSRTKKGRPIPAATSGGLKGHVAT